MKPGDVEKALSEMRQARNRAQNVCTAFAEHGTGLAVGDLVERRNGERARVVRFAGIHPTRWNIAPYVVVVKLRKDGSDGKVERHLKVDLGQGLIGWEVLP